MAVRKISYWNKSRYKFEKIMLNYFNIVMFSTSGLGFRPMPPGANVESTLIWYKSRDKGNTQHWQDELDKFLASKGMMNDNLLEFSV